MTPGDGASAAILMYHSFSRTTTPAFRDLTVSPELLAEHLAALRQSGFRFIAVRDVPAALRVEPPDARLAAVSIDDGLADGREAAGDIRGAAGGCQRPAPSSRPAFVSATSRWLDGDDASRPMLTWHDLADLVGAGMEIGAHGHAHIAADLNREELVRADAAMCRDVLQQRLGTAVSSFAYPFGYQRATARRAIAAAGFTCACALFGLDARRSDDRFALPRLHVGPDDAPEDVVARCLRRPGRGARWESHQRQRVWTAARFVVGVGPRAARRIGRGEAVDPSIEKTVPPLDQTR